jgi:hypothetical protein
MGHLRREIAEVRREKREAWARLYAEWDEKGVWRPHWWNRLMAWGAGILGIYLLIWGDTVERVFGVGFLVAPTVLIGVWAWVWWKALRFLRRGAR